MNILAIQHLFVGFMVFEIPRVSVFGYFTILSSYPGTYMNFSLITIYISNIPYILIYIYIYIYIYVYNFIFYFS